MSYYVYISWLVLYIDDAIALSNSLEASENEVT